MGIDTNLDLNNLLTATIKQCDKQYSEVDVGVASFSAPAKHSDTDYRFQWSDVWSVKRQSSNMYSLCPVHVARAAHRISGAGTKVLLQWDPAKEEP